MTVSPRQIDEWLGGKEDEHLEFKEAKNRYDFEMLVKYCAALANEGGGSIVLGVTDRKPRRVVGSAAFTNLERTKAGLVDRLRLRIDADEVVHRDGRVLVFTAPSRPIGVPIPVAGAYWMRAGEDLVPMTPDQLRRIFDEASPDHSAEVCPEAKPNDLAPEAIEAFRRRWHRKSGAGALLNATHEQLLRDAELVNDGGVTYAALILLGSRAALGRHLAQAEVIFEYRSSEAPGPASQREEFRQGLLLCYDRLWELVNLRNDRQHFQDGLFVLDVPTFDERAVREAILNAVSHRDYRDAGSVFVRQYARRIEILSPGGFPSGITTENLLWQQKPRNRRVAEALGRCGLVERAGQGFDLIYGQCILDLVHRDAKVPARLAGRLGPLVDGGVLERVGRGRGTRYLLSRRFYRALGRSGAYTRRRGLDRNTNKALLVKHIEGAGAAGAALAELLDVLPGLSRNQVQTLLRELKRAGRVEVRGTTRAGRWFTIAEETG